MALYILTRFTLRVGPAHKIQVSLRGEACWLRCGLTCGISRIEPMLFSRCVSLRALPESQSEARKMSYCRIVELLKLFNIEYHFFESVFSRTSLSRRIIQPKVIFPNRHFAECLFLESSVSRMPFSRIVVQPNLIFPKMHWAEQTPLLNQNVIVIVTVIDT